MSSFTLHSSELTLVLQSFGFHFVRCVHFYRLSVSHTCGHAQSMDGTIYYPGRPPGGEQECCKEFHQANKSYSKDIVYKICNDVEIALIHIPFQSSNFHKITHAHLLQHVYQSADYHVHLQIKEITMKTVNDILLLTTGHTQQTQAQRS